MARRRGETVTFRTLLFDQAFKKEIQRLAAHLPHKHEKYFHFPRCPYQGHINHTQSLRHQGQPCTQIGDRIASILHSGLASH